MNIPNSIARILKAEHELIVKESHYVSGGSISNSYRLSTNQGDFFLKYNSSVPDDFFEKEADGLNLLRSANTGLRIPDVVLHDKPTDSHPGFLLMEYINEGRSGDSFTFGSELAKLHLKRSDAFGLDSDNYIGSLPQRNRKHDQWAVFFSEERIKPQLEMAVRSGKMDDFVFDLWNNLYSQLDDLLPVTKPSLVHGDLWGGNYLFDESGKAVLIDPAVYYGHPEMDLAFTKMFGGFSDDFYRGYESISSIEPGFNERIPIYNLYPLLVHANLFGGHYTKQAIQFLNSF